MTNQAVPVSARNAAWLALARGLDYPAAVYAPEFMAAFDEALEAAAPYMRNAVAAGHEPRS